MLEMGFDATLDGWIVDAGHEPHASCCAATVSRPTTKPFVSVSSAPTVFTRRSPVLR